MCETKCVYTVCAKRLLEEIDCFLCVLHTQTLPTAARRMLRAYRFVRLFFFFPFFNQVAKNCVLLLCVSVFGQMNQRLDGERGSGAAVQSVTKFRVG